MVKRGGGRDASLASAESRPLRVNAPHVLLCSGVPDIHNASTAGQVGSKPRLLESELGLEPATELTTSAAQSIGFATAANMADITHIHVVSELYVLCYSMWLYEPFTTHQTSPFLIPSHFSVTSPHLGTRVGSKFELPSTFSAKSKLISSSFQNYKMEILRH